MDDWYRPERFEFGELYVDAEGELTLQFAGTLTAKAARGLSANSDYTIEAADDSEPVLVFLVVSADDESVAFYTHTKTDADRGYGFISIADQPTDKLTGRSRPSRLQP